MLKQQLQQKLQQKLSPQQIQLIKLLEVPAIELEERVKQELQENPALEEGSEIRDAEPGDSHDDSVADERDSIEEISNETDTDLSLGDYLSEDDIPDYKLREINERMEKREEIPFAGSLSMYEHLRRQLGLRMLSDRDTRIAEYIIGNLDDDGYLRRDAASIADDLIFQTGNEVTSDAIETVIGAVQDFDPPGICARNLRECLLLQLARREPTDAASDAIRILTDCFDDFSNKRYDRIIKITAIDEDALKAAVAEITTLDPKPGGEWDESMESVMRITPDFIIEAHNGELFLNMNSRDVPPLRVSREYLEMLERYDKQKSVQSDVRDAAIFVKQKIDSAQWFIDAVRQRQETLRRTMEAIMEYQRNFFLTGDESMLRPMILKDISARAGYDKSTVSRVSNSKYVQTNFGIYPLKYFFSDYLPTTDGEEVTTREVKKILKEYIGGEDKRRPYTDEELATYLQDKGFIIARRTVAKYREQLDLPVARLRKEI
ncbi:MAG: RNA polymerase factor sigma-54 [Tannerellaceae bacterium]|jgi:RNA polymerase sigma-54 factor|nr:RNA polymerase factor sigma-54 [Tannerellaceae bacterium]